MNVPFAPIWGFATCVVVTWGWVLLAPSLGLLDVPEGRKQHGRPVARVGGLALICALAFRVALPGSALPFSVLEWSAVLAMGAIDDRCDFPARWKAGLGLFIALVLAFHTASRIVLPHPAFGLPGFGVPATSPAVLPLLFLMFWGLPQAYNLIDGADGLAIGFAVIVLASLWIAGFPHPFLMGALAVCLLLSWPRARLFLGDCGSLAIGLLLVLLVKAHVAVLGPYHILWLAAYPIVDVVMVIPIRMALGCSLVAGDRSHLHFQLLGRWPDWGRWCVPALWAMASLCASELFLSGPWRAVPWAGLAILAVTTGWVAILCIRLARLAARGGIASIFSGQRFVRFRKDGCLAKGVLASQMRGRLKTVWDFHKSMLTLRRTSLNNATQVPT